MQVVIRHDDFDFRMDTKDYIDVHERFVERELTETAVVQYAFDDNERNYRDDLIEYMMTAPFWDIQLHGWNHAEYHKMVSLDIADEIQKAWDKSMELFGEHPTVWYPPWNGRTEEMEDVAEAFGLTIDNESYDIAKFIRENENGTYQGHSFYFHAWNKNERDLLDYALDIAKELTCK